MYLSRMKKAITAALSQVGILVDYFFMDMSIHGVIMQATNI